MKIFIQKLILFLIPLFVLNLWFYSIVYSSYLQDYENVELNFKTYFLADSRGTPLSKKVPAESFYNFSAPSDSYVDMERKLSYLIRYSSIENLLITVDDHTLSKYRENSNNEDRSIYYISTNHVEDYYRVSKEKYVNRFFPLLSPKSRDIIIFYFLKNQKKKKFVDWNQINDSEKTKRCKIRVAYQFPNDIQSQKLQKSLQNIIELCKVNNIKLFGVKLPLTKEYLRAQKSKSYGADKLFVEQNIEIFDLHEKYISKENFFSNEDHLNKEGGTNFTELICKKIKQSE